MLKKGSLIKCFLIALASIVILFSTFGFWFMGLIPSSNSNGNLENTRPQDLPYLTKYTAPSRGKILAVVTSCGIMGDTNKSTGYEMTELGRAYYVFMANGFEVDVASTLGEKPPVVIDWDDMGAFDYAFLNDTTAQRKVNNSIPINHVNAIDYEAVYFVGGKGAMFDFPDNTTIQAIVREFYQKGKVIGAVCHGPAALLNVTLDDGRPLLENKLVSSFTNTEELFLISNAREVFPYLLEDKLIDRGARYNAGAMYLMKISEDGNLVTGQNPWSTWALAELMIKKLGHTPVEREKTAEEYTIDLLSTYETDGKEAAKVMIRKLLSDPQKPIDRNLLAMHSIVATMQWKLGKTFDLISLLAYVKNELPLKSADGK